MEWVCSLSFTKVRDYYDVQDADGTPYGLIHESDSGLYIWDAFYCRQEFTGKQLRELAIKLDELNGFGCVDTTEGKLR